MKQSYYIPGDFNIFVPQEELKKLLEKTYRNFQLKHLEREVRHMYWVTGTLGFVLMAAPFLFGFTDNTNAMWSSIILGGVTVAVSVYEGLGHSRDRWEYWVALGAGLAAAAAPFALPVGPVTTALWVTVGIGLLLMGSAATKLFNGKGQFG